ncbi:MAG: glucose-1-phosphate adenylyltransferase, partial [Eubacteriales bacterium]
SWRIVYRHNAEPPQKLYAGSVVENSMITEGCKIHGTVKNSVLSEGVVVEAGATVINSVIMRGAHICSGATVEYSIVDQNSLIGEGAHIGAENGSDGITVIAEELKIRPNAVVARGEMVDDTAADKYTD